MKLLVFAHTPPPVHGQSVMVELMVEGLGGDCRRRAPTASETMARVRSASDFELFHVNARLSSDLADVGHVRPGKVLRLLGYCGQALRIRFREGVTAMYYVPSPPRRSALYRDWIVMVLCRPFFSELILHWHGVGLGQWLEQQATAIERWVTKALLGRASLSIVLSRYNQGDAAVLAPKKMAVVANGLRDPCVDYAQTIATRRFHRAAARRKLLQGAALTKEELRLAGEDVGTVRVLFLSHCTRDKGLFDAIEGVRLANRQMADRAPRLAFRLTIVGSFLRADERADFERALAETGSGSWLRYLGFVGGPEKWVLFREADIFCFPTYFAFEGQPVNLIEAMAFGLPVVTTRWRSIPEHLPDGYLGLVEPEQPAQVAAALLAVAGEDGSLFRGIYERQFSRVEHIERLAAALRSACSGD